MEYVEILKNKVNLLSIDDLHKSLKKFIDSDKRKVIDYLNIYSANISVEDEWFCNFINSCEIVLCDGKGIQLAAKLLGEKVPEQIPFNRWLWEFFAFCEQYNYSIFFLGSAPGVYEKAITQIEEKGFKIRMAGNHGYFNKSNHENDEAVSIINQFNADFLLVGFGMPIQEKWVSSNFSKINSKVVILGGAYLDWISGNVKIPPRMVSKLGIEWLYRLLLEPKRLANRYLIGIPVFFYRILKQKFFN